MTLRGKRGKKEGMRKEKNKNYGRSMEKKNSPPSFSHDEFEPFLSAKP